MRAWVVGGALLSGWLWGCSGEARSSGETRSTTGGYGGATSTTSGGIAAHDPGGGGDGATGTAGGTGGSGGFGATGGGGSSGVDHHRWSLRFGGDGDQWPADIALDSASNIVLGGAFAGSIDFGGGLLINPDTGDSSDLFVAKLDPAGQHLWSKRFGDEQHEVGSQVAVDPWDNILVTSGFQGSIDFGGGVLTSAGGSTYGDICLAKLDGAGSHLWSSRFGDAADQWGTRVAADGAGNVIVVGQFDGTVDFGGGPLTSAGSDWISAEVFVAKLDPDGNHLWSQSFGNPSCQLVWGVAADGAGNIVVAGQFDGTVDFGGGPLTSAGGTNPFGGDMFLVKLDSDGNHLWSQRFGDAANQAIAAVSADDTDQIWVAGHYEGTVDLGGSALVSAGGYDAFVALLDGNGSPQWSLAFGDTASELIYDVAFDESGNVAFGGAFGGTIDLGGGPLTSAGGSPWEDALVAKLNPDGTHAYSAGFGDAQAQAAISIAMDPLGHIIAFGSFEGTVDFGGGPLTSADEFDIFLVKLSP